MDIVLLWHMHQPYYVNPLTQTAMMPWVRLHSVKGYLDMVDVLEQVPAARANFNFTPVLVLQILEMAEGRVRDLWLEWSRKPAAALTVEEKQRVLENFFKINWDTCIRPQPRYAELLALRGEQWNERALGYAIEQFTEQDFLDLQVWYNLAWCGFSAARRFPLINELKRKQRGFSEEEKQALLAVHGEIVRMILPLYRAAVERGQAELTTTPFFHPIMPLVYDTELARRCQPHSPLPPRFSAPEDVRAHLRLAQEQHTRVFGTPARGLWPSEGSIAPEIVPLLAEVGIEYFCTDEGNLFRSLQLDPEWRSRPVDHVELFQGWSVETHGARVGALFRERPLSDFVGFNAARNEASRAVDYLVHHLEHIHSVVPKSNACALLALDGENAWEAFLDGGEAFLTQFYQRLVQSEKLSTQRLGDYFSQKPPQVRLTTLHSGSWINSDFDIWIGDPEENKAWQWIGQTRDFLVNYLAQHTVPAEVAERAWMEIYAAEGSDWFWWYGPDFTTDSDVLFDDLFRTHLQNVYRVLGQEPPAYLDLAICLPTGTVHYSTPTRLLEPARNGREESFYDWVGAGMLDIQRQQTAMFQGDRLGRVLYYGFNEEDFFVRIDMTAAPEALVVTFLAPQSRRVTARNVGEGWSVEVEASAEHGGGWMRMESVENVGMVWGDFALLIVPRRLLGWALGAHVGFSVQVMRGGVAVERYPERGLIEFEIPSDAFEKYQWIV